MNNYVLWVLHMVLEQADFVFYGVNDWYAPEWILENVNMEKLYIVGNKSFGNSNGNT